MHFELTITSALFQNFTNVVLVLFINRFVTPYLGAILIYSDDLVQFQYHERGFVGKTQNRGIYVKAEKCEFHQTEVT